ncbi:MAG: hypothetical protein IID37_15525 [Planctomycetes bacterium]|nr:hypothetical protein [Planctomycetota bacterium]
MSPIAPTSRCTLCSDPDAARVLGRKCPRCDRVLGEPFDRRLVDADTNNVRADVRCVECGYNLRTLHVTAQCPECGHLVLHSLTADELVFSDTKWLRRVRSGVTLLVTALLGPIALALIIVLLNLLPIGIVNRIPLGVIHFLVDHALKPFLILGAIGIWRATSPNPLPTGDRVSRLLRPIARWMGMVPAVLLGSPLMGPAWQNPVAAVLAIFAVFVSLPLTLYYVRELALRGRRPGLRTAINVAIVVVTAGGLGLAVLDTRLPSAVVRCVQLVLVSGYLLSLIVFIACRRMLSSAVRRASDLGQAQSP